jgi:hypothetical protein
MFNLFINDNLLTLGDKKKKKEKEKKRAAI